MKNRVFTAPLRLTLRPKSSFENRRRGQALLLAVVVMLFVALISAGFLATVTGNLNQTASTTEKNRAIEAARAGLEYINKRINSEGENWRPWKDIAIPLTGPDYSTHYTTLAQTQGWIPYSFTRNDVTPAVTVDADESELSYVRFPDPRGAVNPDTPRFYARVERIGYSAIQRGDRNQTGEESRAGTLKITVIGLDKNNPNVFHRVVAYRGGYEGAPIGRVARAVGAWDFSTNRQLSATYSPQTGDAATLVRLSNNSPRFPREGNFWITVTTPTVSDVQRLFVTSVSTDGRQLTISTSPTPPLQNGSIVDMSSPLGTPRELDWNRDTALDPVAEKVVVETNNNPNLPGTTLASGRINGSVYWQGNALIKNLISPANVSASGDAPRTLVASGIMQTEASGDIFAGDTTTPTTLPDSTNDAALDTSDIISDGKNRIRGDVSDARQTKPFSPPNLASAENLARYRGLTRDSKASPAGAGVYGYGEGIYIDNIQDREKIGNLEMSQKQLINFWLSSETPPPSHHRLGTPSTTTTDSLEEKHLRGWIARDEFRPRGVLIELFENPIGTPRIRVTRDALNDSTGSVPNTSKTWRRTSPAANFGDETPGKYTEERPFDSTFNGVIFAEGNVRIKGTVTGANKSLTVVSMNNIYIEGSLGLDNNRKVLLLARKNVVVNPTTVISRPEAYSQTTGPSTPSGSNFQVPLVDAANFQIGDYVRFGTATQPFLITGKTGNNLLFATDPASAANTPIRIAGDTLATNSTTAPNTARLASYDHVIQRRVNGDLSSGVRMGFKHGSIRRKVAEIAFELDTTTPVAPTSANMRIKGVPSATQKIPQAQKRLIVEQNNGTDTFDLFNVESLTALRTNMGASTASGSTWRYDLQIEPGFEDVPPFLLTAVGNRRPDNSNQTTHPWEQSLVGPTANTELFIATSVSAGFSNGATNSQIGAIDVAPNRIESFGFAYVPLTPLPSTLNPTANSANSENAASVDIAFYSPESDLNNPQRYVHQSEPINSIPVGARTFGMTLNQYTGGIDTAPQPLLTEAQIPPYHLKGMRLEGNTPTTPGTTLQINAFVYAQTGSWFILPGAYYEDRLVAQAGGTFLDFNGDSTPDPGEFVDADGSGGFSAGDFADADMDGVADSIWQRIRYNYAINFNGAIAENHTALVEDAVRDWMDKWSYPTDAAGTTWQPITYTFDPAYVTGALDNDSGFQMPVSPDDILYQE